MNYTKLQDGYLLKILKGQEIIATITEFCETHNIKSGNVSGIGGVDQIRLYYYDNDLKDYVAKDFSGRNFEIISLNGNISLLDGKPFAHIHIALGDSDYSMFGGHLKSAVVGVTCEVFITMTDGQLTRSYDEVCKLNLLDLPAK